MQHDCPYNLNRFWFDFLFYALFFKGYISNTNKDYNRYMLEINFLTFLSQKLRGDRARIPIIAIIFAFKRQHFRV